MNEKPSTAHGTKAQVWFLPSLKRNSSPLLQNFKSVFKSQELELQLNFLTRPVPRAIVVALYFCPISAL